MSIRSRIAIAAALIAAPLRALAGDAAELNILGFSGDAGIFAFEQYGVQDGSGFAYAERFYIDTHTDRFVKGSPVRVQADSEDTPLAEVRRQARSRGEKIVSDAELTDSRGYTAALNPIAEMSADPFRVVAANSPVYVQKTYEFRLEEFPATADPVCGDYEATQGFRLLRINSAPGGTTELLHEDKTIPSSRGCAHGYRLGGVHLSDAEKSAEVVAVLVTVRRQGFEGPDFRWLAVTYRPDL